MTSQFRYDVLGLGCVAVDDLLYVPAYPEPDSKVRVTRRERQGGGLTATALVAAARLGARCAYAGALGHNDESRFVRECFRREGIDTTYLLDRPEVRPIRALIIVDESEQSRTIFVDLEGAEGAQPDHPAAEVIQSSRVLFVDHFGAEGMIRAARIAREVGTAVVADLERDEGPGFAELVGLVDHLIVAYDFAWKLTGHPGPVGAVNALWTDCRQAVVVTAGSEGCWYRGRRDERPRHLPAYPVEVVDTTGCGDVFHGAYAAALAQGLDLDTRIRFASAAAALKATRFGGQAGIPTRAAVAEFLHS